MPQSMKGYELYSWQEDDGWFFTLITGTNRNKTIEEITAEANSVTEDGWVKITVQGVDALDDLLRRLPLSESIFWIGSAGIGPASVNGDKLALPPQDIVDEIQKFCQEYSLQLTVSK